MSKTSTPKISSKQFKTANLLIEQIFLDDVQIGLMTRSIFSQSTPIRAYYINKGCKVDVGTFTGNLARRDAKTAIIQRSQNAKE